MEAKLSHICPTGGLSDPHGRAHLPGAGRPRLDVPHDYELVDAGDDVVSLIDQRMTGRVTGIEVPLGRYAQIFAFRNGLLTHWKCYANQRDALEAVGLSE